MKQSEALQKTIAILDELISFDTTSRESNLKLIAHIQSYLDNLGIASRLTHDSTGRKANLWATIGPDIKGGVVLSGHIDVVPVDGQDWTADPFKMRQTDGKLIGRGVVDMKGFVAVALAIAPEMKRRNLNIPIHFAFSYDEEVGCIGVRGLIDDVVANLPLPRAVIVGEPTLMKIIGGHKGSRSLRSVVRGVPAHSSDPRLGANSIMAAARLVTFLEQMQQELADNADPNSPFDPPYTTVDLGIINGGTANNIIPEFTTVQWGFRELPADDADALEQRVRDFIEQEIDPGLKKVSDKAGVSTEKYNTVPGLKPDADSPAEQLIRHLSGLNESGTVSFGTEAGLFQQAGMPAVVYGPGSIEQAHQPDEFIEVSQLGECVDFVYKMLDWAELDNADDILPPMT
jgi:acetylornithine deacetylase